jgi:hypothetical protein
MLILDLLSNYFIELLIISCLTISLIISKNINCKNDVAMM